MLEAPALSPKHSMIDSNSLVRTQNDAMISSSVRNPGLYFLTATAIAVFALQTYRLLMGVKYWP